MRTVIVALAAALLFAPSANAEYTLFSAFEREPGVITETRFRTADARTLDLGRPTLSFPGPLGLASFEPSPSGDRFALFDGRDQLRFVDRRAMRAGPPLLLDAQVVSLLWLREDRLLALVQTADAGAVLAIDPRSRQIVRRTPLSGPPTAAAKVGDSWAIVEAGARIRILGPGGGQRRTIAPAGGITDTLAYDRRLLVLSGRRVAVVGPRTGRLRSVGRVPAPTPNIRYDNLIAASATRVTVLGSQPDNDNRIVVLDRASGRKRVVDLPDRFVFGDGFGNGFTGTLRGRRGVVGYDASGDRAWRALRARRTFRGGLRSGRYLYYRTLRSVYAIDKRSGAKRGRIRVALRDGFVVVPDHGDFEAPLR